MRLDELMETIVRSRPAHWHQISRWGGPSAPDAHPMIAVYVLDAAVTIGFGLDHMPSFEEPWAKKFPDPNASSSFVDVFYNGSLVYRDVYVDVDGGRAKLPLPRQLDILEVPVAKRDFFRLLDTFEAPTGSQFDDYFRRAGLTTVDEPWPRL